MRKRILFVDDESAWLNQLRLAFQDQESNWEMVYAESGDAALKLLQESQFDVVITDMHMPGMTGAQLLNEVGRHQPKTVRFILADSADKELIMKCVLGTHQFLAKPCEPESLKSHIQRALVLDQWIGSESLKNLVSRLRTFPSIPSLYFEVLKELGSPNASAQRVGEIIGKDLAMTTKLLQMINSAFFGMSRQVTDPTEAVTILGFETVKSLVLCIQVFAQFDKVKPTYFSIDKLWRHCTAVAQAARKIAQLEEADSEVQEEAYLGGLLHDLGKLVLVSNFGEQYQGAQTLARKNKLLIWDVEKDLFGAAHSEIGAYLIGLWGLPLAVVEAAALHHAPLRNEDQSFKPLTAVHAANVLILGDHPDTDGFVAPSLDMAYLAKLKLIDRVPVWRNSLTGKPSPKTKTETPASPPSILATKSKSAPKVAAKPAAPSKPKPPQDAPEPAKPLAARSEQAQPAPKSNSMALPISIALVGGLLVWFLWPKNVPPERAVNPPQENPVAPIVTPPDTTPAAPDTLPPNEPPAPAVPAPMEQSESPTPVAEPSTNVAPAEQPAAQAPPIDPFARFKVQSILFRPNDPLVMINGKLLKPNDTLDSATVISIAPRSIVLQIGAERRTLTFTNTP